MHVPSYWQDIHHLSSIENTNYLFVANNDIFRDYNSSKDV